MSVNKITALRAALRMEKLEDRCVPNSVPVTADEQYFLELLNRARLDPNAEAQRLGIDLNEGLAAGTISSDPKQPLVANAQLLQAIRGHLSDLSSNNFFSHTGSNGSSPWDRIDAAGYTNWSNAGENLAWTSGVIRSPEVVEELHNLLFIDPGYEGRGHRTQMMNGEFREIGPALLLSSGAALGGQDFGTRFDSPSYITGVAFDDSVLADDFYTPGEGIDGVSITAVSASGAKFTTITGAAGGYSLGLPDGNYTITFESARLPNNPIVIPNVQVSGQNVKLDLPTDNPSAAATTTVAPVTDRTVVASDNTVDVLAASPPVSTPAPVSNVPTTPTTTTSPERIFAGSDVGAAPMIRVFSADGQRIAEFFAFESSFRGGVRLASGDVNGDGVEDIIAATGPGRATEVRVFDGNNFGLIASYEGFEGSFQGGLYVAAADFTGDNRAEIIVSPDEGGGPRVRMYDGATGTVLADFFGIDDPNFRGGARVAAGDLNGDGIAELAVGAGFGGGPRLAAFDGRSLAMGFTQKVVDDFFVFEQTLRNGVFLSLGDLNGDGRAELVIGGGPGGAPRVLALDGAALASSRGRDQVAQANFYAGDVNNRGGVRVAARDINGDGRSELLTGLGEGGALSVTDGNQITQGAVGSRMELNTAGLSNGIAGVFVG